MFRLICALAFAGSLMSCAGVPDTLDAQDAPVRNPKETPAQDAPGLDTSAPAKPNAPAAAKNGATTRNFELFMMGNRCGGLSMTATEVNGGHSIATRMLIKMRRGLGDGVDEFVVSGTGTETYDKDWNLTKEDCVMEEAGVKSEYSYTIKDGKLVYNYTGKGAEIRDKAFDLPKDFGNLYKAFHDIAPTYKEEGVSSAFQTFSGSGQSFEKNTLTVSGKEEFRHGETSCEAWSVSYKSSSMDTTAVVNEDFLPFSLDLMDGLITATLVDSSPFELQSGDWSVSSTLPVNHAIKDWRKLESLSLRMTVDGDDGKEAIVSDSYYQAVTRQDAVYTLTLAALRPAKDHKAPQLPITTDDKTVSKYLEATPVCQSGHKTIMERAKTVVGDEKDSLIASKKIVEWVEANVQKESGPRGNATALEVLENMEGDCTEHAALVVALCRAVGIPARNASGIEYLVGSKGKPMAGYHAWAEAWVGAWVGLDATIPETGTSARYILLGYNEPEEENGNARFGRCLGKTRLDIFEYKLFGENPVKVDVPAPAKTEKSPQ